MRISCRSKRIQVLNGRKALELDFTFIINMGRRWRMLHLDGRGAEKAGTFYYGYFFCVAASPGTEDGVSAKLVELYLSYRAVGIGKMSETRERRTDGRWDRWMDGCNRVIKGSVLGLWGAARVSREFVKGMVNMEFIYFTDCAPQRATSSIQRHCIYRVVIQSKCQKDDTQQTKTKKVPGVCTGQDFIYFFPLISQHKSWPDLL